MKTVNKQFLENQVRLALNEIGMSDGALSAGQSQGKEEDSGFDFSGLATDIFLGAEASREQVMDLASSSWKYGLGAQSHIKRAINSTKSIGAFESFVFKFIKTAPLNSSGDVNITWNEKLFTLIYSQCDKSSKEIEKRLNAGKIKEAHLVFKDFIQNKIFDDIFDEYGITDKSKLGFFDYFFVGSERKQVKTTFKPNDKWCQEYAINYIKKGSNAFDISRILERAICENSYALRKTPSGKQAVSFWDMQSEAAQSNIPKIVAATVHAEYSRSQSEPMTAFISVADVTLSALGTISMALSLGATGPAKALVSPALRAIGGRLGAANTARAAKLGIAMRKAVAVNKVVGGWKFTIGDIIANGAIVGYQIYNAFDASLQRLMEKTVEYFEILKTTKDKEELQSLSEGIRNNWITVIDQFIKIQKTYVDGMNDPEFKNTATGLLNKAETEGKEAVVKIMELYKSGNRDGAMQRVLAFVEFSKKVEKVAKRAKEQSGQIKGKVAGLNSSLQEIENKKKQINQETLNALKPTASAVARSGVINEPKAEIPQEVRKNNFGSDEKTSDQIYDEIVSAFPDSITENVEDNVVKINLGYKDAIEFSKGTEGFSKEKTLANIEKIKSFLQSKGKQVSFTPVPVLRSSIEGVDEDRFKDFSKEINTQLKTTKTSKIVAPAVEPVTDKPSSDREVKQGKDVSDVSGPEILIIGDSTSHNIVTANPILKRGEHQKIMGYVDGNGKKVPYIKKANGKIDYSATKQKSIKLGGDGKARFPGYSGHASHGGASTTYIKNSLSKLLARDESYAPKVAIISMGYNDPPSVSKKGTSINNFKSIISALKERGVKDIRIIEPRADKGSYKRNADLIRPGVYDLADSVVKIVPNPTTQDGGPPRGDGVHYTPSGARRLFKDAMSGLTVSSDVQPSVAQAGDQKRKQLPAASSIQQNFAGPEAGGAKLDEIIAEAFYKEAKRMDLSPEEFDRYSEALASIESGGNKGSTKRYTFQNRYGYIGKYQIGYASYYREELTRLKQKYNIPDNIIPAGTQKSKKGLSILSKDEFVNLMKSPEGFQLQELLYAAFQAGNYTSWVKGIKTLTYNREDRLGIAATAHNAGGAAVSKYLIHRANYNKTKDPKYLMRMWAVQDGNAFPSENFYRKVVNKVFGASYPNLPMGKISILKKYGGHKAYGANGVEYWSEQFGDKVDIQKYYKNNGLPSGAGPDPSVVAAQTAVVGTSTDTSAIDKQEKEEEKPVSMPTAEAAAKFEKRTNEIDSLENFKEIVVYMTELYGTMVQTVKNNLVRLKAHVEDINASDLASYRNNKFKELTSNVHRKNRSKLFSLYKTEKEKDEESANRLMALLHRPRLVTYISTDYLLYTTHDGFNLSFELGPPHGNKVGVALRRRDFLRNSSFGDGIEKQELKRILIQNRDTFIKFKDKLLSFGPGELEGGDFGPEDNRQYLEFLSSYVALFNAGIEALEDKGSALRRSWIIDNLSAAIYLLS